MSRFLLASALNPEIVANEVNVTLYALERPSEFDHGLASAKLFFSVFASMVTECDGYIFYSLV